MMKPMTTEKTPMASELRPPQMTRENMSRPFASTPMMWSSVGP